MFFSIAFRVWGLTLIGFRDIDIVCRVYRVNLSHRSSRNTESRLKLLAGQTLIPANKSHNSGIRKIYPHRRHQNEGNHRYKEQATKSTYLCIYIYTYTPIQAQTEVCKHGSVTSLSKPSVRHSPCQLKSFAPGAQV